MLNRSGSIRDPIHATLAIPPNKRSISDISDLMKATINVKFFQDLIEKEKSNKIHQACCKMLNIAEFKTGKTIFKKGDAANAVYFILKGQVRVLVPTDAEYLYDMKSDIKEASYLDEEESPITARNQRSRSRTLNLPPQQLLYAFVAAQTKTKDITEFTKNLNFTLPIKQAGYKEIASIGPGSSFGELALYSDKPRCATLECIRPTVLAVLSKEDYQLAASIHEKATSEKIEFLQSLPEFLS